MKKWILTLMLITFAGRVSAYTVPYESWMGAYVGDKKAGYVSLKIDKAEFDGVQGYRIASCFNSRIAVLGVDLTQLVTTIVFTDANYAPLKEDFSMSSGGKTTRVSATFKKDTIDCVISAGSGSSTKSIPIPPGASLVGDAMFAVIGSTPEIGREYKLNYFNPLTLAVEDLAVKVERAEKIKVGGQEYDTIVMKNSTPMGDMTMWQEPSGDVVQVEAMMGIRMVRESRKDALAGIDGGTPEDFAVLTSIKPDRAIPSPRQCGRLVVSLRGLPEPLPNDARQKFVMPKTETNSGTLSIASADFGARKSLSIPVEDAKVADFLASTPYLDSAMPTIQNQARAIVGDEKNAYTACTKIRAWISENLHTQADIGITRSASDVLKSKVGVCRDYAILFAALARSAHVPAKVVSGLVYTDGAFYYHAWAECYVGEWVAFDATQQTDFVDATHIKLAEGDATSMFGLARVIGSLKVEVKDSK